MIDINELTIGQIKEISNLIGLNKQCSVDNHPWVVGQKYFIRTVTMHLTGELVSVSDQELLIKDAAWIADSGRFHEALRDINKCKEVEPFPNPVIVGRGSIVDATIISSTITKAK